MSFELAYDDGVARDASKAPLLAISCATMGALDNAEGRSSVLAQAVWAGALSPLLGMAEPEWASLSDQEALGAAQSALERAARAAAPDSAAARALEALLGPKGEGMAGSARLGLCSGRRVVACWALGGRMSSRDKGGFILERHAHQQEAARLLGGAGAWLVARPANPFLEMSRLTRAPGVGAEELALRARQTEAGAVADAGAILQFWRVLEQADLLWAAPEPASAAAPRRL